MKQELQGGGHAVTFVAINAMHASPTQQELIARTTFDLLQDVPDAGAWGLMGGGQDDFFIYREGGTLGRFISAARLSDIDLSTAQGYSNVKDAILGVLAGGPGPSCAAPAGGLQVQGDLTQDAKLDISDPIALLTRLFGGSAAPFPCQGGSLADPGNRTLLDANGDAQVDLADPVHVLNHLFRGGPAPAAGVGCAPVAGCPDACAAT